MPHKLNSTHFNSDVVVAVFQGSASEVMMLRTARRFDPETNTVVFGTGTPFTQNSMAFGGLQDYVDTMFEFSRGMSQLYVDNAQYALLTAICTFSGKHLLSRKRLLQICLFCSKIVCSFIITIIIIVTTIAF